MEVTRKLAKTQTGDRDDKDQGHLRSIEVPWPNVPYRLANAKQNDVSKFCQVEEIAVEFRQFVLENERILAIG